METQVQTKKYSAGYSSIWGLNETASSDLWSLYHENKAPKIGQYGGSFLPRHLTVDHSFEYENEKVRQTILKHESIFRHQLQELHRLYGRQRELMNVFRRRDGKERQTEAETSNFNPFSGNSLSEVTKPTRHASHIPSLDLVFGQSSILDSTGKQSFSGLSHDKSILAVPSRDDARTKVYEPPNFNRYLLERRVIDLESPSGLYIKNEEKHLEERVCRLSGVQSNYTTSIHEMLRDQDKKSSFSSALNNHQNDDALRSSLLSKRNNELVDLNEPIPIEETSISGSSSDPGNFTFNLDNGQKADLYATSNSILQPLWKDSSLSSIWETNGGTCFNNLQSRNERKKRKQLTHDLEAKLMRPDSLSIMRDFCSMGSAVAFQSSQVDPGKNEISTSEQGKTEGQIKRKLFGVDIFEVNDDSLATETNMVCGTNKFDEFSSNSTFVRSKKTVHSSAKTSFSSSVDGVSYQNGISLSPQLYASRAMGNSGADRSFSTNSIDLVQKKSASINFVKSADGSECLDWKSAEIIRTSTITSNVFQDDIASGRRSGVGRSKPQILKGSPLYLMEANRCPEQIRGNKNSYHLNLESLQNSSQQFFKSAKSTSHSSQMLTEKQENMLPLLVYDSNERNTEVNGCISTEMKCHPLCSNKLNISKDFAGIFSRPTCLVADSNNDQDIAVEKVSSRDQPGEKDLTLEKPVNNSLSHYRCHIDLNLSVIEGEAQLAPCLPTAIMKLATTEIDLEVPVVFDSESGERIKMLPDKYKEPYEELSRLAAEAIVAISASGGEHTVNDGTHDSLETAPNDCLKWLAEVVSSYECHDESNVQVANLSGDGAFTEELIPEGMDYFEFMTLKLKDAKSENYFYSYTQPILENQDEEEEEARVNVALSRRPRRGQARRGRQHKDFQRDILPSLISLSKLEVTEDFQTFEELLRATGYTWQSSFRRKSNARNGRGRRRSVVIPSSHKLDAMCPPLEQKPLSGELELGDKTLTGWGKRTRRLPRQRCMNGNTALVMKHE